MERDRDRPPSKLQSAIYYALDGDQVDVLTLLAQRTEDPWVSFEKMISQTLSFVRYINGYLVKKN